MRASLRKHTTSSGIITGRVTPHRQVPEKLKTLAFKSKSGASTARGGAFRHRSLEEIAISKRELSLSAFACGPKKEWSDFYELVTVLLTA